MTTSIIEISLGLLFLLGIPSGMFLVGLIIFLVARKNRKIYICESCGEKYKFEQLNAKSCSVCGGKLVEIKKSNSIE